MENQLEKIVKESGLEKSKAQVLLEKFTDYFQIAADWELKAKAVIVTDVSQIAVMKMAGEGRKFLKQKRVDVENTRKQLKEQSLREGQTIDAIAKILKNLIEPIEDYLEQQEKFIQIKEQAEKEARKVVRMQKLTELEFDFTYTDILNMPEEQYQLLITRLENERDARIEAEKKAEAERIAKEKAEAEERERMIKENERLKKEADAKEKLMKEQQAKAEAEKKAIEDKARKEREEADRKLKAEQEAARRAAEKAEKEKAKLEAEIKAKKDAEEQARIEAERKLEAERKAKEAEEKKAAAAPDKVKLTEFSKVLTGIIYPEMKTTEAKKIITDTKNLIGKVVSFIGEKSKEL